MAKAELTDAERKHLDFSTKSSDAAIKYNGPKGYGRSAWTRCMVRMLERGLIEEDGEDSYRATEAGRLELAKDTWAREGRQQVR